MFFLLKKRCKEKNVIFLVSGMIFIIMASVYIYCSNNTEIGLLLYIVTLYFFLVCIYECKKGKLFIIMLWILLISSLLDNMSLEIVEVIYMCMDLGNGPFMSIWQSSISLIFIFWVGKIYNNQCKDSIESIGVANIFLLTILASIDAMVVSVMSVTTIEQYEGQKIELLCIAFIGVILGIFIQLAAVILLLMQKKLYKEREEFARKYLDEQKSHYDFLENRECETKKFRHDIKSHMGMLKELVERREYNKFDEYVEELHMKVDKFGKEVTVHNGVVDAVVNQYYEKAKSLGVIMNVSGRFPIDCEVNAYDICTIFSNALSNAIEAAEKSDEKKVELSCRYTDKNILIVVKNSYKNVGQFKNEKMETTKNDKLYHGFGFANIKETVVNNKGMLDVDITDNEFKLTIMIGYMEKRNHEDSNCG